MFFILSKDNKTAINDIISKHKCVCLYHWNECGHCKMLMPTWKKICKKYQNDKNVLIINIEVENLPLLKSKYKKNIQGFPTIIKYDGGKALEEYMNERTFAKLSTFIQK